MLNSIMLNKKEILIKLIEEEKVKGCTILGKPKQELIKAYFSKTDIMEFLESNGIKVNEYEFYNTDIGIYFPELGRKVFADITAFNASRALSREEIEKACDLFEEIYNYYQISVPARLINKICGLYKNEPFTINDLFMLIKDNQSEIARQIGKNRQVISDIKTGKCNITTEILSLLMNKYPLLPYDTYLRDFNK